DDHGIRVAGGVEERHDVGAEPADGVGVGRVAVAADEQRPAPAGQRRDRLGDAVDVPEHLYVGAGQEAGEQGPFVVGHGQDDVGGGVNGQLLGPVVVGPGDGDLVAGELGGPAHAHEVDVDRVDGDPGARRHGAEHRDGPRGEGVERDDGGVEAAPQERVEVVAAVGRG